MKLGNLDFQSPADTQAIKTKMFVFQRRNISRRSRSQVKNYSTLQFPDPEQKETSMNNHAALNPKLPSKKLFQEPKFFMTLQRKKDRIIGGLKNMSQLQFRAHQGKSLPGHKRKQGSYTMPRRTGSSLDSHQLITECNHPKWQHSPRTPFLHFNMHYLIRKHKTMTATPSCPREPLYISGNQGNRRV